MLRGADGVSEFASFSETVTPWIDAEITWNNIKCSQETCSPKCGLQWHRAANGEKSVAFRHPSSHAPYLKHYRTWNMVPFLCVQVWCQTRRARLADVTVEPVRERERVLIPAGH